jgi:hypothetical protein
VSVRVHRFSGYDDGITEHCLVADSVMFCPGWHIFVIAVLLHCFYSIIDPQVTDLRDILQMWEVAVVR